jgi:SRSO17 transposase
VTQQEKTATAEALVSVERWRAGLDDLLGRCAPHFRRIESRLRAKSLVEAMMTHATHRNCWTLAEAADEPNPYRFQHLLSRAKWDDAAVRAEVRSAAWEGLSTGAGVKVLVVDETGDVKKGEATVGVQRQYSGTAGKIENCQLAVFLALACEQGHAAIDTRLYLPRSWADAPDRRAKAGVPESVGFRTKAELAWEMIADALGSGMAADFVAADEAYGVDTAFRTRLESWSQSYVLSVARTTPVDAYRGGRKLTADEAISMVAPQDWEQRSAGDGAKGRRYFHWTWIDLQPPSVGGHASLLARRNSATRRSPITSPGCLTRSPSPT